MIVCVFGYFTLFSVQYCSWCLPKELEPPQPTDIWGVKLGCTQLLPVKTCISARSTIGEAVPNPIYALLVVWWWLRLQWFGPPQGSRHARGGSSRWIALVRLLLVYLSSSCQSVKDLGGSTQCICLGALLLSLLLFFRELRMWLNLPKQAWIPRYE